VRRHRPGRRREEANELRVKVVINPAAGQAEPILSVLNGVFGDAGIEWDVAITHEAGDGEKAAREAADQGFDLVGAYGGDGSVAEVASALAEGGPPILLLPGGTGNVLAAELGIPPDLAGAAALAVGDAGTVRRVDLGRVGKRWFVLRLAMGFEAAMVLDTTRERKDRYGWLAYALTALQSLSDRPSAVYSMTIDGESIECEGLSLLVANSAGTGVAGVQIAPDVSVSDGVLDVVVVQGDDLPMLLGSAADVAQGIEPRILSRWRGTEIHIDARPTQALIADGEECGSTPVDVTVAPGAIGVVVPRAVADEAG
jgi:diacylglycerol kinase (ATP)